VPVPYLGKDSFQEVDIAGIVMPVTKHSYIVKDISELADTLRRAFYIAQEGRPGPVLVDIPSDVTTAVYDYEYREPQPIVRRTKHLLQADLDNAAELINGSKKILVLAGGGVVISGASEELTEFVEKLDVPICLSAMGMGGFPASNEHFTGMIGMHGTKTSNIASSECDLLIAIGARFSDRVISDASKFAPNAKVLHIDIDPAEINKNIRVSGSVIGDVKEVLKRLNAMLPQRDGGEWMEWIRGMKAEFPLSYEDNGTLKPQYVLQKLDELAQGEAIVVTEVGQHQMWACHYIKYEKPRTFLTSGGLGTMGYGFGAAIGAALGHPGKVVFNIAGDGCFRMNSIELATAVEYNVPVIVVIMNNHTLGMVRQWQDLFFGRRYSSTTLTGRATDFVKLAEAYGAVGMNVTKPEEVEPALKKAMELRRPVLINCEIDIDEKVFPMVPAGAGIDELIMSMGD
jgi:acetolactate synthase-1/2/3 large subunit